KPSSGLQYLIGFLRTHGLKVRRSACANLYSVSMDLDKSCEKHTIERRDYYSPRPNSVWHMDGHHKLIRWGIVIHGVVDGYDRMVSCVSHDMYWAR
ncbi:hypothetical protein B0H14DRAFT_2352455, partial [Mycena olivaceomarginata]